MQTIDVVKRFLFIVLLAICVSRTVGADGSSQDIPLDDISGVAVHSETTLIYNTAVSSSRERLRLIHQDATVEQLASTTNDVHYYGIAVAAGALN